MIIHYDEKGNIIGIVEGWVHDSVCTVRINEKKMENIVVGKVGDNMQNEDQIEKAKEIEKNGYKNFKIIKGQIL